MPDLSWRDAILRVLHDSKGAMSYVDITSRIADLKLKTTLGTTPAASVNATLSGSIKKEGDASPFVRVSTGRYGLRSVVTGVPEPDASTAPSADDEEEAQPGFINAFGMYWARNAVLWKNNPRILGRQQPNSDTVDFCEQRGVYLLHDGRSVVYVGRATDRSLGDRLFDHTRDRLNGRWDRFSWFGVYAPSESGGLDTTSTCAYEQAGFIATMEALLIEGLEPPQNRKRGDEFRAVEYLQGEDPDLAKRRKAALLAEMSRTLDATT